MVVLPFARARMPQSPSLEPWQSTVGPCVPVRGESDNLNQLVRDSIDPLRTPNRGRRARPRTGDM